MEPSASAGELRRLFDLVCDLPREACHARLIEAGAGADTIAEIEALLDAEGATAARVRAPVSRLLGDLSETELGEGDRLGAWRLVRRLASGGMGTVYLAERIEGGFEQRAAVKLIRGLAQDETLAHFARERQILATLEHPCIARLLDGGATPGGQPYLVMEYIEGVPIDAFCRDRALALDARLDLFRAVCDAVRFAHQRLIVHCDLKPSNVLVRSDGTPVLLDFGIARAVDRPLAESSADASRYFTPGYASPEQARGEALTTASDIYALGLILFELVSSRKARVDSADRTVELLGRAEARPSQLAADVAWRGRLVGDLDAIVLRATTEEPAQRYASVEALADDVRRFLEHRPVLARAQTLGYRAGRALRRHWLAALAAGLALVVLAGFTWRLVEQRDRARLAEHNAEQVSDFLVSVFNVSNPSVNPDRSVSARDVLDQGAARIDKELAGSPVVRARLLDVLATAYRYLGEPPRSAELFRQAIDGYLDPRVDQPLEAAAALAQLAVVYANNSFPEADAERAARRSLALRREYAPGDVLAAANSWNNLGVVLDKQGKYEDAAAALTKSLDLRLSSADVDPGELSSTYHNLGMVARHRRDYDKALDLYAKALEIKREHSGEHSEEFQTSLLGYAQSLASSGARERAIPLMEQNIRLCRELYGEKSANYGLGHNELGSTLHDLGRFREAAVHYKEAMRVYAEVSGETSAQYAVPLNNLASAYEDMGDYAAAIPLFERSLALRRESLADTEPAVLRAQGNLGRALTRAGRLEAARPYLDAAIAGWRARVGEGDTRLAQMRLLYVEWLLGSNRDQEATAELAGVDQAGAKLGQRLGAYRDALAARLDLARGDLADALEKRRAAWQALTDLFGARHPVVVKYALDYAQSLSAAGRDAEARAIVEPLRDVIRTTFVTDAPVHRELARWE